MVKTKIIAELGYNFIGNVSLAKKMITSAKKNGADIIKLQIWSVKHLKKGKWDKDGRRELYVKSELNKEQLTNLFDFCNEIKIEFMVSIFNVLDLKKLPDKYDKCIKIPSPEIINIELLKKCRKRFKEIIISAGASTEKEVKKAYLICKPCTILHCVNLYPCPIEKANLQKIKYLQDIFPNVGYSDHTIGIAAPAYAISNQCCYLEKHFTTNKNLPGRDNSFSATPKIMKEICMLRDNIFEMTNSFRKEYIKEETGIRNNYRGRWNKQ